MASKYSAIFGDNKESEAEEISSPPAPPAEAKRKSASPSPALPAVEREPTADKRRPGRPPGKKSSQDFTQVTIYILDETHRAVKRALLDAPGKKDFSQVAEEALQQWLRSRR